MPTKKNCWPDGRAKVWFEVYNQERDICAAGTLLGAVRFAKRSLKQHPRDGVHPVDVLIYEVHSRGGWNSPKEDKVKPPRSLVEFLPAKEKAAAMRELAFRCLSKGVTEEDQRLYRLLARSLGLKA